MMELMHESGWGAWLSLLLAISGAAAAIALGRRKNPVAVAVAFAVAVLASGFIGAATAQRAVANSVLSVAETNLETRIEYLALGMSEAASNLLLSGIFALGLCALGIVLAFRRDKTD
jgi:hypothetical protein